MTELIARLAVDPQTLLKAQILRGVRYGGFNRIGDLTRFLFDDAWQEALNAGLVSEKMLIPQAEPTKEKVMA